MYFKTLMNKGFFIFILILVTWAFFNILLPYFSAILWASILAIIFNPIKNRLSGNLGNRNGLASIITVGIICLIVFIPLAIIVSLLTIELNVLYIKLIQNNTQFSEMIARLFSRLPDWANVLMIDHDLNNVVQLRKKLSEIVLQGSQYLAGSAFSLGKGTFSFAVKFIIMLYLLFFLLRDGCYLINQILNSLPMSHYMKYHLFYKFVAVSRATVKVTVVASTVQGTLGGISFYIIGIDNSILWGTLIAFLSLIPAIGSAVIWIPAACYVLVHHKLWQGFFLIGFFMVIIGLIDNVLRPLLVGKDTKMPDYLILIATLGGIEVYGINGFISGPLIAALFVSCWNLLSWFNQTTNNHMNKISNKMLIVKKHSTNDRSLSNK